MSFINNYNSTHLLTASRKQINRKRNVGLKMQIFRISELTLKYSVCIHFVLTTYICAMKMKCFVLFSVISEHPSKSTFFHRLPPSCHSLSVFLLDLEINITIILLQAQGTFTSTRGCFSAPYYIVFNYTCTELPHPCLNLDYTPNICCLQSTTRICCKTIYIIYIA